MRPSALRHEHNQGDNQHSKDSGSIKPAERQPAIGFRLVEEISDGSAERSRQDERAPEQQRAGNAGEEICCCDHNQRAAFVAKPVGIRYPVAERGTQRLRKQDRGPVNISILGEATVCTEIEPACQYQTPSEAIRQANRTSNPPGYPTPSAGPRNPPSSCRRSWSQQ